MSDKYGPLLKIAKTEFINKITDGTFEEKCLVIIIEHLEKIYETLNAIKNK